MSHKHIAFHYVLRNAENNQVIEDSHSEEPLTFLSGTEEILPDVENALLAMTLGEKKTVTVPAERAYGERDNDAIVQVERSALPKDVMVGQQYETEHDDLPFVTVIAVEENHVLLDGNHPLAGQPLQFDLELVEMREATADEINAADISMA